VNDGDGRDATARARLKQRVQVTSTFDRDEMVEDDLVLNKKRLKTYHRHWDDMSSAEASDLFEDLHAAQDGEWNDDNQKMVKIKDNTKVRKIHGAERKNEDRVDRSKLGADEYPKLPGDRAGGRGDRGDQRGRPADRAGGRSDRRADRAGGRGDRGDLASGRGSRADRAGGRRDQSDEDSATTRATRRTRVASSARSGRKPRLTAEALSKLDEDESASGRGAPTKRAASLVPPDSDKKRVKLSPVEFMKERAKLRDSLQKVVEASAAKSSVLSKFKAAVKRLTAEQLKRMDKAPLETQNIADEALAALRSVIAELETLRVAGLVAQQDKADSALGTWDEAEYLLVGEFAAVNFLLAEKAKENKQVQSQTRYQRTKVISRLLGGGWGKNFSKAMAQRLEVPDEIAVDCPVFDKSKVQLWTTSQVGQQMLDKVADFRSTCTTLEDREKVLQKSIVEHPTWKGAMIRVDTCSEYEFKDWPEAADFLSVGDIGNSPWATCAKPWAWRYGPFAWPMPGFGSWVQASETAFDITLLIVPVEGVVKQGIALKDLPSFLETPSGSTYAADSAIVLKLPPGAVAFVPFGFLDVPLVAEVDEKEKDQENDQEKEKDHEKAKDKQKIATENAIATLWVWSPLVKTWAADVDPQAWAAIVSWNRDYMAKHATTKIWNDREKVFSKFVGSVRHST
jgi:hypothetical protein